MYQSKISLSYRTTSENKKLVKDYLSAKNSHKSSILKRRISLTRYYDANKKRKSASIRFASFFVGLDILRRAKNYTREIIDGSLCIEIEGKAKNGEIVFVHIREELTQKDKQLFIISTFYTKK